MAGLPGRLLTSRWPLPGTGPTWTPGLCHRRTADTTQAFRPRDRILPSPVRIRRPLQFRAPLPSAQHEGQDNGSGLRPLPAPIETLRQRWLANSV